MGNIEQGKIKQIQEEREKQIAWIQEINPDVNLEEIEKQLPNPELSKLRGNLARIEGMEHMDEIVAGKENELVNTNVQRLGRVEVIMSQSDSEIEDARERREKTFETLREKDDQPGNSRNRMLKIPTFLKSRNSVIYSTLEYIPSDTEIADEANLRLQFPQNKPFRKTIAIDRSILKGRREARKKELEIRKYILQRKNARENELASRINSEE